jgi:hypothetical protein
MSGYKKKYWTGWNKEAAGVFNQSPATISLWSNPKEYTVDLIIKHNKLLDWVLDKLINEHGVPTDEATRIVNKDRVGYEKCLEE